MNYDAILFDLDGTLIDTAADFVVTVNKLCELHNTPKVDPQHIRNNVSNGAGALVELALGTPKHSPNFQAHRQQLLDIYEQELGNSAPIFPELKQTLEYLQNNQLPWAIITNKPRKYTELLLKRIGLQVPVVVCPCDLTNAKPDPEGLFKACQQLAVDPQQCIYLGDHERDILAGKQAGMPTVTCLWGYISHDESPLDWEADFAPSTPQETYQLLIG